MRYSVLLLTVAALTVSGCDRKAGGQTVAVVNGDEITSAELNSEVALAQVPPGADKKEVTSRILQAMIDRHLLAQQAKEDGLDKTPEFLTRQRRATEDALITMIAQRKLSSAKLPTPEEIAAYEQSRPEQFAKREILTINQIVFPTQTDPAFLKELSGAHSLDAIAQILSAHGLEIQRGQRKISSGDLPHDLYVKIEELPAGEPFIIPGGAKSVANVVTGHEPAPLTGEQSRPVAVASLRQQQGAKVMEGMLKDLRGKAKIEYKEGFKPKS